MAEDATALAVYGSLVPGEKNHWVLRGLDGEWMPGIVRGFEFEITWGPAEGYEGFVPDDGGNNVAVMVLVSDRLENNLGPVDDFHGDGFVRQAVSATLSDDTVIQAWIHVALTDS